MRPGGVHGLIIFLTAFRAFVIPLQSMENQAVILNGLAHESFNLRSIDQLPCLLAALLPWLPLLPCLRCSLAALYMYAHAQHYIYIYISIYVYVHLWVPASGPIKKTNACRAFSAAVLSPFLLLPLPPLPTEAAISRTKQLITSFVPFW